MMTDRLLAILFTGQGVVCALLLAGCPSKVILRPSPGETPGITMGPFPEIGSAKATSAISVESQNGFNGPLNLSAWCCYDAVRDRDVQFGSSQFNTAVSPTSFFVPANGTFPANLNLEIASLNGMPSVPFGKYVVRVDAANPDGTIANQTRVGAKLLPDAYSEPAPSCRASVAVLPINSLVALQIAAAEATPRKTELQIAVFSHDKTNVWEWLIDDAPGRLATEAAIVLKNETGSRKIITTTGCSAKGQDLTVEAGQTGDMVIDQRYDRTIVFQERVCHDPFCWGWHMVDVDVLSETSFWSVFGGKKATFRWIQDH